MLNLIYSLHHSICSTVVQTFGSWIISVIRLWKLCFYFPVDFSKWVLIPSFIFSICNNIFVQIKVMFLYRTTNNILFVFLSSLEGSSPHITRPGFQSGPFVSRLVPIKVKIMKAANVTNEQKCSKNHISRIINRQKETREHEFPTMSTCIQSHQGTSERGCIQDKTGCD